MCGGCDDARNSSRCMAYLYASLRSVVRCSQCISLVSRLHVCCRNLVQKDDVIVMYVLIPGPDGLNGIEITGLHAQDCSGQGSCIDSA